MFHIRNVVRITKYLLLSALTLSTGCLAAARVQIGDSHKEAISHSSSRSLLYSWDDNNDNTSERVLYIVVSTIVFAIAVICRCCLKYGCNEGETQTYSRTVLHAPPRTAGAVVSPPPTRYGSSPGLHSSYIGSASSGSSLAPPRTSRSIILPFEGDTFPSHLYGIDNPNYGIDNPNHGIDNPNYQPTNFHSEQYSNVVPIPISPIRQNQTPLCDILDMPPSYDTVVKEDLKYPKPTGKS